LDIEKLQNHIVVMDLRSHKLTGKMAAESLHIAGIATNKNAVPFDTTSPFITSGIRLGTSACTTLGFKEDEFQLVGNLIGDILDSLKISPNGCNETTEIILSKVKTLMSKYC
jgi:glycine hydroxymethyltransferase